MDKNEILQAIKTTAKQITLAPELKRAVMVGR